MVSPIPRYNPECEEDHNFPDVPGVQGFVRMRIPEDSRVTFWTIDYEGQGVVHVHSRFVDGLDFNRVNMPFNPWMKARCGLLRREQDAVALDTFADERLCRRCVTATPFYERIYLFEHGLEDE